MSEKVARTSDAPETQSAPPKTKESKSTTSDSHGGGHKHKKKKGKKGRRHKKHPDESKTAQPKNNYDTSIHTETGRPQFLQSRIQTRIEKAKKSNILDLSSQVSTSGFRFDLHEIPSEVFPTFKMSNLRELWLTNNQLAVLPYEICVLQNLKTLGLSGNKLSTLPPRIATLQLLERLIVDRNQISSLPQEINKFRHLRELRLDHNHLSVFMLEITEIRSLLRLGLSHNKLTEVPPEVRRLTRLIELDLDDNQITEIPYELGRLAMTLRHLGLANNLLAEKPPCIDELEHLDIIRLSGNRKGGYEVKDKESGEVLQGVNVPVRHDGYLELCEGMRVKNLETGVEEYRIENLEGHLACAREYNLEAGYFGHELFTEAREILQTKAKRLPWKSNNRALSNKFI